MATFTMAQKSGCLLHSRKTGLPVFSVSLLSSSPSSSESSSSSPHPFLQLLGLSDQELQEQMAKGHSYAFNMGNNNIIPFSDFRVAAEELMKRNMREVLLNRQTGAVFMPEAHLPDMPRIVDEQRYMTRKRKLDDSALKFLGMKQGTQDFQVANGNFVEKEHRYALKLHFNFPDFVKKFCI